MVFLTHNAAIFITRTFSVICSKKRIKMSWTRRNLLSIQTRCCKVNIFLYILYMLTTRLHSSVFDSNKDGKLQLSEMARYSLVFSSSSLSLHRSLALFRFLYTVVFTYVVALIT